MKELTLKRELVLIKLGGSVITNKSREYSLRKKNIDRLAGELKQAFGSFKGHIILGHGAGSFAHVPAAEYKTKDGIINSGSIYGMAVTEDAARKLNMIIISKLLEKKVPAFSFSPASFLISDAKVYSKSYFEPIQKAMNIGIVPVVYGDVILDKKIGCTIFSTEKILSVLAQKLSSEYQIRIIYVTDVDGVYDKDGKTIPVISRKNFDQLRPSITGAKGVDVTGGMLHKVEEALKLAEKTGIRTSIVNGTVPGKFLNTIFDKKEKSVTLIV